MFRLGYNTNGLAHHRLLDALELLAELGYEGVAITPDAGQLDPLEPDPELTRRVRDRARELHLDLAVETGARYLLDPRRKHFPTLLEDAPADRARRLDFLFRSIDLASELEAGVVSIWSGAAPRGEIGDRRDGSGREFSELWKRLADGVAQVLEHARRRGVRVGLEPEPGMFIERPAGYVELAAHLGTRGRELGLTLDVGHLLVTGDVPEDEQIRHCAERLVHVHLDDIRDRVHEHRPLGDGELNLPAVLNALADVGYGGMVALELSRDSYRGAWAAETSMKTLRSALSHRA
jgi:sugar phosphate isomerase/epimerase